LTVKTIFSQPTISQLAIVIDKLLLKKTPNKDEVIEVVKNKKHYNLSQTQLMLWSYYKLDTLSTVYNENFIVELEGELDIPAFTKSLEYLIDRHEALRINFLEINGQPFQKISTAPKIKLDLLDFSQKKNKHKLSQDIINQLANQPFKLESELLFRFKLIKLDAHQFIFVFFFHHIIADDKSLNIFIKELIALYNIYLNNEQPKLPEFKFQFKDYAESERRKDYKKKMITQEKYWLKTLKNPLPILQLPSDKPKPTRPTYVGDMEIVNLDQDLTDRINEFCQQHHITSFALGITVFSVFLQKLTGQTDIILGMLSTLRKHNDFENMFGPLFNTSIYKQSVDTELKFADYLTANKQLLLEILENSEYPINTLIEKLKLKKFVHNFGVYNIMYQHNEIIDKIGSENLGVSRVSFIKNNTSKCDLRLIIRQTETRFLLICEYNTDLFCQDTIKRWLKYYLTLLKNVLSSPESKISDLELITEEEKYKLINDFSHAKD
jgi:hypothetical protein